MNRIRKFHRRGFWLWWASVLGFSLAACRAAPPPTATLPTIAIQSNTSTPVLSQTPAATATFPPATPSLTPTATPTSPGPQLALLASVTTTGTVLETSLTQLAGEWNWGYTPVQSAADLDPLLTAGPVAVVFTDPTQGAMAAQTAPRYPASYFVLLGPLDPPVAAQNLLVLEGARADQVGFLAGMAAGFATTTQRVAAVAEATVLGRLYQNGFLHGTRYTCPRCDVKFFAPDNATAGLYTDVVFVAPSPVQADLLVAAAQAGAWVIGADSDAYVTAFANGTTPGADRVLTSVSLDTAAAVSTALRSYHSATIRQGVPLAGTRPLAAETGAVVLAPYRTAALNGLDQQEIAAALTRLADTSLDTGVDPATGEEK